jgi:putative protease
LQRRRTLSDVIKPEIKSPAGHWPQLHAAIEAGADAVYFGLTHFTARAKAGFTLAELPEAMRTLHRRGVKGYITYNTLIFDNELDQAARGLAAIAEAGADAIIVQDPAIIKLARTIAPGLAIHGSTQMSVTDAAGVRHAQSLGVNRLILARELSLEEIRAIRAATDAELELFVHGALCVSYSGQCFSSEAWGGRSANRGQCAQACRLPYEMLVDGSLRPLGDARYLLSPGDLYALEQIPEIVSMGISALKIEGRYKDAAYVALTTRAYREAVDKAWAGQPLPADPVQREQLEQVYSRGLGPHFLAGTNHQAVVEGRAPRHRGVRAGRVLSASADRIVIEPVPLHSPLKPGDGVVFDAADWRSPEEPEEGGRLYAVTARAGTLELAFANGAINPARIRPGDLVWRTHDPDLDGLARIYTEAAAPVHKQIVNVLAMAREHEPLRLAWTLARNPAIRVEVESAAPLVRARSQPLDQESLRGQLARLGNTAYALGSVDLDIAGAPFAPPSLLNELRRQAVDRLELAQSRPRCAAGTIPPTAIELPPAEPPSAALAPQLHLLVRTPEQLDAALRLRPASITLDYLDLYGLRPSIKRVKDASIPVRLASPRILKPGEERIADFLLRCDCPVLVRPAGLLHVLRHGEHPPLHGDFSLNAANALVAREFLEMGLERLTPSHDLNAAQVAELARRTGPARIEAVAYQHLPVFHTEYCVFCRFLSRGASYRDCGRPCEKHRVALRDAQGRPHPVLADVGCRNTVFGAEAQEASAHLTEWLAAGIRHFRLEFAHESGSAVTVVARAFERYFEGGPLEALRRDLHQAAPAGTTEGSLFVPSKSSLLPILR